MNLDNKCRTCLRIPKQPKHLFNGDNTILLEKIEVISSVEIAHLSELPSQICEECFTNINHFYNFRKVIINTAQDLETRLETLKNSHYSLKPRSNIKYFVKENENASNYNVIDIKSETDLQYDVILNNCDNSPDYNDFHNEDESNVTEDTTEEKVFKCEHPEEILIHKLQPTEAEVACKICGKTLNAMSLKTHKFVHSMPRFTCEICGKTFKKNWQCARHVKIKHEGPSKDTHSNVFSKCLDCEQTFPSKIQLRRHRRAHHLTGVCTICGAIMRADNLLKHVKNHSEGPCTCDICGKTFKNSESLRFHRARHMEQKEYTCETCGTITNSKRNYYRHLKYHKDPDFRKIMCSVCGKKVVGLKRHMLSHTGGRPYSCTYCEKGFTSPYALKVHTRQHTKERPYICEYCSEAFPQKVSLKTHLKSKHGITE